MAERGQGQQSFQAVVIAVRRQQKLTTLSAILNAVTQTVSATYWRLAIPHRR